MPTAVAPQRANALDQADRPDTTRARAVASRAASDRCDRRAPAPEPALRGRSLRSRRAAPREDHFGLALYYQRVGDFDHAIAHYRALLEQNDASAEVHNNLGLLYEDHGQRDDAVKQFQRAIAIDPKS